MIARGWPNPTTTLGLVLTQSDPDEAEAKYLLALEDYRASVGESHPSFILTQNNLAIIRVKLGLYDDALATYHRVLSQWTDIYGKAHPNVAFTYSNIGQAHQKIGDLDSALIYQKKALSTYQSVHGTIHPDLSATHLLIADVYKHQGEYNLALVSTQNALKANCTPFTSDLCHTNPSRDQASPNEQLLISALKLKAELLEDRHYHKTLRGSDLRTALKTLEACDDRIEKLRRRLVNKNDRIKLGSIASEVYEQAISLSYTLSGYSVTKKQEYLEMAFEFCEKSKSAVLLASITESKAKKFAGLPTETLTKEADLKGEIRALEQVLAENPNDETARKRFLETEKAYEAFTSQLEKDHPKYYELKYDVSVVSVKALQESLDSETQVRSYFIAADRKRLFVFEVTHDRLRVRNIPLPDDFDRQITGMRNAVVHKVKDTYKQNAYSLYHLLFPSKVPISISHLQIIPDGRLGILPFEALLTKKPREATYNSLPFLIKKHSVGYSFSATLMHNVKSTTDPNKQIVLFAPVLGRYFGERSEGRMNSLPGTQREVEAIAQLAKEHGWDAQVLLQEDATEAALKSPALAKASIKHLATHGMADEENPELSEVFLHQDDSEDGDLFTGEIFGLDYPSDLVIISACQTGLGKVSRGEGIIGLSRAFVFAGAKNLVVSYWSVADASTSQLTQSIYRAHFAKNMNYRASLRRAKLDMIEEGEYAEPFYWAAFVLIGR